jgi:hypothetical protein
MIGFLAKRQSGKDTACDHLVVNYKYCKQGFADPLKRGIQKWFGFSDSQMFTEKKEEVDVNWGISPRYACQKIGTDVVRDLFPTILLPDIGDNFWIKRADIWYEQTKPEHNGLVVWNDVRYQNEVDYILSKGGIVIKLERPELREKTSIDLHKSESGIEEITNYSIKLTNDGNLLDFYKKLDTLMSNDLYSIGGYFHT